MRIRVKLFGILKTAANTEEIQLTFDDGVSVRHLVSKLVNTISRPDFEAYLIDADTKDPRPNALILVSGTEIGALKGIDTVLKDKDEVVFLPVAHGGEAAELR